MTRGEIIALYDRMVDLAVRPPTAASIAEVFEIVVQVNDEPAEHLRNVAGDVVALIQDRARRDPTVGDRIQANAATVRQMLRSADDA